MTLTLWYCLLDVGLHLRDTLNSHFWPCLNPDQDLNTQIPQWILESVCLKGNLIEMYFPLISLINALL